MKRWLVGLMLIAVAGAAAWLVAPHGAAQGGGGDDRALVCRTPEYDLNKDGVLSKADMTAWSELAQADGCMYASLDDNEACRVYDFNHNRFIDDTDVAVAHDLFMECVFKPGDTRGR